MFAAAAQRAAIIFGEALRAQTDFRAYVTPRKHIFTPRYENLFSAASVLVLWVSDIGTQPTRRREDRSVRLGFLRFFG